MEYLTELFNQIIAIYSNATLVEIISFGIPAFFILWILFVNVMFIKIVLLKKYPDGFQNKILLAILIPLNIVASIYDVLFNITYGSLMFLQVFEARNITFTHRMKAILRTEPDSWRGKLSMWICRYLIEPWDQNHCGLDDFD